MNILVVDDEKFNLAVAKSFIENLLPDAIIITCSKPETVMDILATERVDIILLDIIMPGMTGFDLLKEVRAKHEFDDIQIIILTSITDNESFKYCFEIGADDYIRKPIDPVEFNARLKAAVKSRQNTMILKQTQYQMIQKEKLVSIGELAAGIAHEINNPIGFIGSNLETMHNFINKIHQAVEEYRKLLELIDCGNPSASDLKLRVSEIIDLEIKLKLDYVMDDLDNIISESIDGIERVAKIVQSLKVFSRSAVDNELTDNNLGVLMEDALMMVRNEAKYTIEIETEYMDTMDVFCNKGQIVQVMVNLLLNAIQAIKSKNPNCRGHLKVRTYTENGYACCSITDDGPGIPDSIRDKIFNPFFTTKAIGQGTGLGLSISLDIITKKHNGKMTFFNETSGGTTFIFMLPLNKDERVGVGMSYKNDEAIVKKRVLFVDDEVGILKAVTRLFLSTDYDLLTADSAEAGLKLLENVNVDLVVSDMRMPGTDGFEFLSIIKKLYPHVFRIILSGYSEDKVIITALQRNVATIYILKPWDNKKLIETIDQIFEMEVRLHKSDMFIKLNNISDLPALKSNYQRIISLVESDAEISEIAAEIERDQSVASKVLRMANSAYFGVKTGSIKQALLYLGLQNIHNLILSSSIRDAMEISGSGGKYLEPFWEHAIIANRILIFIYKECLHTRLEDMSQTAGLLHNIGLVFYMKHFRKKFLLFLKDAQSKSKDMFDIEIEHFGISHQEIGGYLLKWWGLPFSIVEATLFHHTPLHDKIINKELVCTVHLASVYAWKLTGNERYAHGLEKGVFSFLKLDEEYFEAKFTEQFLHSVE